MGSLYQPGGLVFAQSKAPPSTLPICVTAPSSPYSDGRSAKQGLTSAFTTSVTLAPPCCLHRGTHPKLVQELLGRLNIAMTLDTLLALCRRTWGNRP